MMKSTNNFLWVDGVDGLDTFIENKLDEFDEKIFSLKYHLKHITSKAVKGRVYLYEWVDGRHTYLGREEPGHDIKATLAKKIEGLDSQKALVDKRERVVVIRKVGRHLIVSGRHKAASDIISIRKLVVGAFPTSAKGGKK